MNFHNETTPDPPEAPARSPLDCPDGPGMWMWSEHPDPITVWVLGWWDDDEEDEEAWTIGDLRFEINGERFAPAEFDPDVIAGTWTKIPETTPEINNPANERPDQRTYWGIYYPGMDEWQAKRSRAAARSDAEAVNDFCRRRGEDYCVEVKEWPFGRERWILNLNHLEANTQPDTSEQPEPLNA